jgi:hypothetical protein
MEGKEIGTQDLVAKTEGKKHLGRPGRKWVEYFRFLKNNCVLDIVCYFVIKNEN